MNYRILVTGGAGFIGSHTVDALIHKGHEVRILDALTKPVHLFAKPKYVNKEAEFIKGDIRNKSLLERSLKHIDVIYHFAAYQDYLPNFSTYFDVNASGTALIYEIIVEKKLPIKKVIVASSQAIYGEGKYRCKNGHFIYPTLRNTEDLLKKKWDVICPNDGLPLTPQWVKENDPIDPHNQYAISKYSEEKIALHLGKRYGIPSVTMRYSIVQGPRQSPFNLYSGALRIFVTSLLADRDATIFEDGKQLRDFVNIFDVVKANLLVLENSKTAYQTYNVGGGRKWTIMEFYRKVRHILKSDMKPVMNGKFRVGDTRHIISDIGKIRKVGFSPKYSIDDSILTYTEWVQTLPNFKKMLAKSQETLKTQGFIRQSDK